MSGHSKWSTIKHQKEVNDKARGKLFSKLSRAISLAAKQGGANPETNYKLKIAIDTAKSANMPKINIDRVLSRVSESSDLLEIVYEGFGPEGVQIMVEVATDNKNRSAQEIKHTFEKGGGTFAGPGAVSFNFEPVGYLVVGKLGNVEEQMLTIIDMGVKDVNDTEDGIEVYTDPSKLSKIREDLESRGYQIKTTDFIKKPKVMIKLDDDKLIARVINLLESFDELEDVQALYSNLE